MYLKCILICFICQVLYLVICASINLHNNQWDGLVLSFLLMFKDLSKVTKVIHRIEFNQMQSDFKNYTHNKYIVLQHLKYEVEMKGKNI